ncbi:MAG TPA: DMT family transporter [Candidatus Saccharimonadales bacterium]|nr:DMT family transporter [Candidatus Saccharimonadales bacterium]
MKRKTKNFLFLPSVAFAAAYLIWGFNTAGIKIVVSVVPIYAYLAIRYGIGALVLYPMAKRKTWRKIPPKVMRKIFWSSVFGTVAPMVLISIGLQMTSAVTASVIYLLEPILMYVLSMEMLRERFRPRVFMGLIVSMLGSAVLIAAPLLNGHEINGQFWGNILVLLAVITSVIGAIIIKPILNNNVNLNQITVVRFIQSFVLLFPFALWQLPALFHAKWTPQVILAMLYGIIFATILAFPIYHYGLKKLSGEEGSVYHYLDPVGGILSAVVVLHETISTLIIFGSLLVCWGIYLSETRYKFVRFPFLHAHK